MDGRQVLVIHGVPLRLADKPAPCQGQAYLRQSDGDCVMHPHELRMLDVARLHADERVDYGLKPAAGAGVEDLVPELVQGYLRAVRERDRRLRDRSDAEILRRASVLTASGEPTLAGLYPLGDYPQGLFPALTVTAAVQVRGGEGQPRNRNLEDFTGPVPVMLEELMDWVRQNLGTEQVYRADGHMERQAELPLTAIRELLANALVHRDLGPDTLGAGKSIQVRLDGRKLLIQSPGGLRGVSLAQLESDDHAQAAVNQRLYQIAKKLTTSDGASVIEGEAGGIREVFQAAESRGLDRPVLIDTGVQFSALVWRPRVEGAGTPGIGWPTDDRARPDSADVASGDARTVTQTVTVSFSREKVLIGRRSAPPLGLHHHQPVRVGVEGATPPVARDPHHGQARRAQVRAHLSLRTELQVQLHLRHGAVVEELGAGVHPHHPARIRGRGGLGLHHGPHGRLTPGGLLVPVLPGPPRRVAGLEHEPSARHQAGGDVLERGVPVLADQVHGHVAGHHHEVRLARPDQRRRPAAPLHRFTSGPCTGGLEHGLGWVDPDDVAPLASERHRERARAAPQVHDAPRVGLLRNLPEEGVVRAGRIVHVVEGGETGVVVGVAVRLGG